MGMVASRRPGMIALILLSLLSVSCSKITGSGGDGEDDGNAPYMIGDLRLGAISDSTIQLKWTATGDDSDQGTAHHYDIRYFRSWVNWATWDSAIQVTGEPSPSPAGATDSMTVGNLLRDSTYYFAVLAYDEAGNNSNMSNCVSGTCFSDIAVVFPDDSLEARIRVMFNIPTGDIHRSDLVDSVFFEANSRGITDLTGMNYWTSLITILINGNHVSTLAPISGLIRLLAIQFDSNRIADLTPIAGLINLEMMNLRRNLVNDISALANKPHLHMIYLEWNQISDIHPLVTNADFAVGDTVYLTGNPLTDQSAGEYIDSLRSRGATVIY